MTNHRDLLRLVCEANAGYLALGNERWQAQGATFLRNRTTPRRHDANALVLVRAEDPGQIHDLFQLLETEFDGFSHRSVGYDALTPAAFGARLALEDGYRHSEGLVQVLEGKLLATARPVEIREVLSEDDWAAYQDLDEMWWRESGESETLFGPYDRDLHDEMMVHVRLKAPAVRRWFALVDSAPRAFFASWPGENGVGMVEDLFCHPEYRRRGLATALLAHCVADARDRGAGPVIINSNIDDTPKRMYAAMGFRPLYINRSYTKRL